MRHYQNFKVKIYADGADIKEISNLTHNPMVTGFTTNPSLMRKANVTDYEQFAHQVIKLVSDKSISFEVFADELSEIEYQAKIIASWGKNVYVKIPITTTQGESTAPVIINLAKKGIAVNVTAITTIEQVETLAPCLDYNTRAIVSIFAGRIADTGVDPMPTMIEAVKILKNKPQAAILWASSRELFNMVQAEQAGCHIITMTPDMIKKLSLFNKDLIQYSLETVSMFYEDAKTAGYTIDVPELEIA